MIEKIVKSQTSSQTNYPFCILIPSWNNLKYLQLCIRSIQNHAELKHQIIVIINEGSDGTLDWVKTQTGLDYVYAVENIGICYGLNACRSLIKSEYIVYANDDMYFLPDWDKALKKEIEQIGHKNFMLSATMIEPHDTGNACVVVKNYGDDIESFDEDQLLKEYSGLGRSNWKGSTWPPNVVHIDLWDLVGGMSIEFSPGMYSDPDLSRKLYSLGVRYFKGVGDSLVYHFGTKSTRRIKKNKGSKTFLAKWGISSRTFTRYYLNQGADWDTESNIPSLSWKIKSKNRIKRLLNSWKV